MGPLRWKQGRDLALLSLASYARSEHETEGDTGQAIDTTEDEQA